MKKILIIGSSGFVGKSIIEHINNNSKIFSIYTISRKKIFFKKKLKIYLKKITKNILKVNRLPEVDFIIYLLRSSEIPKSLLYFNKFHTLLRKIKKKPKILFVSSGAVYGKLNIGQKPNENQIIKMNKINNLSGYKKKYAKEKIMMEKKFIKLSKQGYPISIARCFTFVGNNIINYNYAISDIIKSIQNKKKIILKNKEKTFRSYMHSYDMSRWLIKILKNSNTKCPIYNVGSDHEISLFKLSENLAKKYGNQVTFKKNKNNKIDYYVPSNFLAKKKLKLKITIKTLNAINSVINSK